MKFKWNSGSLKNFIATEILLAWTSGDRKKTKGKTLRDSKFSIQEGDQHKPSAANSRQFHEFASWCLMSVTSPLTWTWKVWHSLGWSQRDGAKKPARYRLWEDTKFYNCQRSHMGSERGSGQRPEIIPRVTASGQWGPQSYNQPKLSVATAWGP